MRVRDRRWPPGPALRRSAQRRILPRLSRSLWAKTRSFAPQRRAASTMQAWTSLSIMIVSSFRARRCSGHGLFVRARGEPEVRRIDAYERLASRDGLPGIDQTLENLPWNAEPQVALHSRRDDAGERTVPLRGGLHRGNPHEGVLCSRVNGGSGVVACRHRKGDQTDEDEEWGRTALKHGDLRKNERLHTTTSDYLCQ